jgi:hypothetical protein
VKTFRLSLALGIAVAFLSLVGCASDNPTSAPALDPARALIQQDTVSSDTMPASTAPPSGDDCPEGETCRGTGQVGSGG